jgi:hypothetical protein
MMVGVWGGALFSSAIRGWNLCANSLLSISVIPFLAGGDGDEQSPAPFPRGAGLTICAPTRPLAKVEVGAYFRMRLIWV